MDSSKIAVGLGIGTQPPLGSVRAVVLFARLMRLDSVMAIDHFQNIFPTAIWDEDIGVGVTDPIRRHPVVIAQAMLTLSHLTKWAPILGIGAGERMNIDPYGLDFTEPVGCLEEALRIIRMWLSSQGPIDFEGKHYKLDGALMDLRAPKGRHRRCG